MPAALYLAVQLFVDVEFLVAAALGGAAFEHLRIAGARLDLQKGVHDIVIPGEHAEVGIDAEAERDLLFREPLHLRHHPLKRELAHLQVDAAPVAVGAVERAAPVGLHQRGKRDVVIFQDLVKPALQIGGRIIDGAEFFRRGLHGPAVVPVGDIGHRGKIPVRAQVQQDPAERRLPLREAGVHPRNA